MTDQDQGISEIIDVPKDFGQAEAPAEAATPIEQPRDPETGKFAAKPEAPTEAGVTTEATPPVAPSRPEPGHVPIAALLDTRDKHAAERRRADELQARLDEYERQKAQQPSVDIFTDPQKWEQHQKSQQAQALVNMQFNTSELVARQAFGDEKVDQALEWAKSNLGPADNVRIQTSRHPFAELVKIKGEREALSEIGTDPKAYREKLRAELLAELKQTTPAPVTPQAAPVNTPPSMASVAQGSAASTAQTTAANPSVVFDEMFNR
jgi:hypothetical protein